MRIYRDTSLKSVKFWGKAQQTAAMLTSDELDQLEEEWEKYHQGEWDETELKDLFRFQRDYIAEVLGYEDWAELTEGRAKRRAAITMSRNDFINTEILPILGGDAAEFDPAKVLCMLEKRGKVISDGYENYHWAADYEDANSIGLDSMLNECEWEYHLVVRRHKIRGLSCYSWIDEITEETPTYSAGFASIDEAIAAASDQMEEPTAVSLPSGYSSWPRIYYDLAEVEDARTGETVWTKSSLTDGQQSYLDDFQRAEQARQDGRSEAGGEFSEREFTALGMPERSAVPVH